jgi:hypothetical protein
MTTTTTVDQARQDLQLTQIDLAQVREDIAAAQDDPNRWEQVPALQARTDGLQRQATRQLDALTQAEQALAAEQGNAELDTIRPTMEALAAKTLAGLSDTQTALNALADAGSTEHRVASAKAVQVSQIASARVHSDAYSTTLDGRPIGGRRSATVVELVRMLAPVFDALGDGQLANEMRMRARAGNRLPGAAGVLA